MFGRHGRPAETLEVLVSRCGMGTVLIGLALLCVPESLSAEVYAWTD